MVRTNEKNNFHLFLSACLIFLVQVSGKAQSTAKPPVKEAFSYQKLLFGTSLFDIIDTQGKRDFAASELWNEYEANEPFKAIPDSIYISTFVDNELLNFADNPQEFIKRNQMCIVKLPSRSN